MILPPPTHIHEHAHASDMNARKEENSVHLVFVISQLCNFHTCALRKRSERNARVTSRGAMIKGKKKGEEEEEKTFVPF